MFVLFCLPGSQVFPAWLKEGASRAHPDPKSHRIRITRGGIDRIWTMRPRNREDTQPIIKFRRVKHGTTLAEVRRKRNPYVYTGYNVTLLSPKCQTAKIPGEIMHWVVTIGPGDAEKIIGKIFSEHRVGHGGDGRINAECRCWYWNARGQATRASHRFKYFTTASVREWTCIFT